MALEDLPARLYKPSTEIGQREMVRTMEKRFRSESIQLRRSDKELWSSIQEGEPGAFEELHGRYEAVALRVARRICGQDGSEDCVQAAFLSIWRGRSSFNPSLGSLRGWILTVVRHRAIDALRERGRPFHQVAEQLLPEPADTRLTDVEVATRETGAAVREAVAELPPAQRQVIELAYFREFTHTEIASALRIPLGTVKGRNRLALQKLPHRLSGHRHEALAAF